MPAPRVLQHGQLPIGRAVEPDFVQDEQRPLWIHPGTEVLSDLLVSSATVQYQLTLNPLTDLTSIPPPVRLRCLSFLSRMWGVRTIVQHEVPQRRVVDRAGDGHHLSLIPVHHLVDCRPVFHMAYDISTKRIVPEGRHVSIRKDKVLADRVYGQFSLERLPFVITFETSPVVSGCLGNSSDVVSSECL